MLSCVDQDIVLGVRIDQGSITGVRFPSSAAAHSLYVGGKQEELRLFLYIWKLIAARQSDDGDDALAQAPPGADAWALN